MTPNESAAKHEWIPENVKLPHCCSCGWECNDFTCTERDCRVQWEAHVAAAQPLVAATEGPEGANVLKDAEAHLSELAEAWDCGALSEHDGLGGTRSNRNASLLVRLRAALAESQQQAAPLPTQSRSVQRRIAAQKGEPAPTFAAAAPATEGKLREDAEHRLFEANVLVGKIQKIVREALPGERWSEWDVLDQGVLQALAQVRREALEEAANHFDQIGHRVSSAHVSNVLRALAAQPTGSGK
jgi:hypothetical protein